MKSMARIVRRKYRFSSSILFILLIFVWIYTKKYMDKKKLHIFVLRTFYYPSSRVFNSGGAPINALVVLLNMESNIAPASLKSYCLSAEWNSMYVYHSKVRAVIEPIYIGEVECKITTYRLLCLGMFSFFKNSIRLDRMPPIELKTKRADTEKKSLVVCPGRMFAFEQWHLFVTAMELHRALRVDLVVVYIQSVDDAVYELVKLYELEGLIDIRSSLLMPKLESMSYNPNAETQWNNQIVNFQECLYDFRESSDFIAFPDWDDLMLTPKFEPWPQVLPKIKQDIPNIASFIFARYIGAIESLENMARKNHSLVDVWKKGLSYTKSEAAIQHVGKVLARPEHVAGIRFHDAALDPGYEQRELPMQYAYIIHSRNYFTIKLESRLKNNEIDQLIANFEKFSNVSNLPKLLALLPKKETALDAFNGCLGFIDKQDMWGRIVQIVRDSKDSKCYSFNQCKISKIDKTCVNVKNSWNTYSNYRWSVSFLMKSKFQKDPFCIV